VRGEVKRHCSRRHYHPRGASSATAGHDAIVERLADLERQSARMERQIKIMIKGDRTSALVAKAMSQSLTKRVDRLETEVKRIAEEVE
jgi:polyhydroxyalkanoate synthesis regulator phasin